MDGIKSIFQGLFRQAPEGHKYFSGSWHGGKAKFYYIPDGESKVLSGNFEYVSRFGGSRYIRAKGHFVNDLKDGDWTFESRGNSTLMTLDTQFSRGVISGSVEYYREEAAIGFVRQWGLSFRVSDGRVVGSISGQIDGGEISGACDDEGYPHGEWSLRPGDGDGMVSKEIWDHGTLVETYEEHPRKGTKKPKDVGVRRRVNFALVSDCAKLLSIVGHGSSGRPLYIPSKKAAGDE